MSLLSARSHKKELDRSVGHCFPLSLDACMRNASLPTEVYDMFTIARTKAPFDFNAVVSKLLKDFFKVEPLPDTATAPVACFSAYGASPQHYFPDVPYEYDMEQWEGTNVTEKQLRIRELIKEATERGCHILFDAPGTKGNSHVSGLEQVDPSDCGYNSYFIIRDGASIAVRKIYDPYDLSGISLTLEGGPYSEYAPLPEFSEPWYPDGQTSPNLIILPPEPI